MPGFGHALNLARAKQGHGQWQKWKKEYVPGLSHSSEHRYRNLAERLTEDSLEGMGLTEAYRLLDLTYTKTAKECGDSFPDAPKAFVAGSSELPPELPPGAASGTDDPKDDIPDDFDDLAALPPPDAFSDLPPATGLMEAEAEPERPRWATGPLEGEGEAAGEAGPDCAPMPTGPMEAQVRAEGVQVAAAPKEKPTPAERFRASVTHASQGMEAIQAMTSWLMKRKESFRRAMWRRHCVDGFLEQVGHTIEALRWLAANLDA